MGDLPCTDVKSKRAGMHNILRLLLLVTVGCSEIHVKTHLLLAVFCFFFYFLVRFINCFIENTLNGFFFSFLALMELV